MNDETTGTNAANGAAAGAERVGFCQDCGRPLSRETARTVGSGVFCEPCLETRLSASAGTAYAAGQTAAPRGGGYVTPGPAVASSEPKPMLAGLLGVIPGVGAMYNGQYAKGLIHFVIFAVLVSIANNVSDVFGLFVFAWICYQVIEAYHTAVARRDGLPLPNPFGFNELGERMGFGKSWPGSAARPVSTATPWTSGAATDAAGSPVPPRPVVPGGPVATAPDWVGYVPPSAFGAPPPAAGYGAPYAATYAGASAEEIQAEATRRAYESVPYATTYAGPAATPYDPSVAVVDVPARRRFPVGAFWLIGLGLLILAANLIPDMKFSGRWLPPVLFAGLSLWLFTRRLRTGVRVACILRWPVIFMVLAVMFALHAANFAVTFGLTCAVLLIAFGGVLLLERTAGSGPAPDFGTTGYEAAGYGSAGYGPGGYGTSAEAAAGATQGETTTSVSGDAQAAGYNDATKGGQG